MESQHSSKVLRLAQIKAFLMDWSILYLVYSTGHLLRNRKAGPGWISCLRMGAFYTNFSITNPEFLTFSCRSQRVFLIARFLIVYRWPVLYISTI